MDAPGVRTARLTTLTPSVPRWGTLRRTGTSPQGGPVRGRSARATDPRSDRGREGPHRAAARRRAGAADPDRALRRPGLLRARERAPFAPVVALRRPRVRAGRARARTGCSPGRARRSCVVRGHDGVLRAFYNSCRHRGAPVVRDDCGAAKRLTCQYHSWSYDTRRRRSRRCPTPAASPSSTRTQLGLTPVRCETWQGFVFVSEDPDAPSLRRLPRSARATRCRRSTAPSLRVLGRQNHRIECNWKLLVDAFLEVYHIRTVHPDNAALLYDDRTATVAMLPNGHSRLTVAKRRELIPIRGAVGRGRQPVGAASCGGRRPPRSASSRTSWRRWTPAPSPGCACGPTVLAPPSSSCGGSRRRGRAASRPRSTAMRMDAVRDRDGPGHRQHERHPALGGVARRAAVPDRVARTPDPPLPPGRRPGHRARPVPDGTAVSDALDAFVEVS